MRQNWTIYWIVLSVLFLIGLASHSALGEWYGSLPDNQQSYLILHLVIALGFGSLFGYAFGFVGGGYLFSAALFVYCGFIALVISYSIENSTGPEMSLAVITTFVFSYLVLFWRGYLIDLARKQRLTPA